MTKIAFATYGCSLNVADSETMGGFLEKAGFEIADEAEADLVIINSCTVKALAETKFYRKLKEVEKAGKKVILAGCVPQAQQSILKNELKNYSVIGTRQLHQVLTVVEETLAGNTVHIMKGDKHPRLNLPKARRNDLIEIVPICEGCLGSCTYCKTVHARGSLFSYEPEAIVKQITTAVGEGCKEIWLTSQDNGAYGQDIGTDIVQLLEKIIEIPGDFKVRVGMANPDFCCKYNEGLARLFKSSGKLFKFIHIPVQAGNNKVLEDMKREYTAEQYYELVQYLKREIPDLTISTDIICGFPTETDEQFQDTIRLIHDTKPDVLNVSRFWPRPGTRAAFMPQLHGRDTNARSRSAREAFNEMAEENMKKWRGWEGSVLVDEKGKDDSWIARNYAYKQIVLKGDFKLGDEVKVKVVDTNKHYLVGKVI